MLYSIGYQKMKSVKDLIDILNRHKIKVLVDVRSKTYGRKYQFNKKALQAGLPSDIQYVWKGSRLGGFGTIDESDIAELAKWQEGKAACLMCMEADPDQCHRKYEIGERLKTYEVDVVHLEWQQQNLLF